MKPFIINWLKWFQHGIKVLLASTAAVLVIAIPYGIIKMAIESGQQALQMLGALSLLLSSHFQSLGLVTSSPNSTPRQLGDMTPPRT